jgi:hypothetical protein
MIIAEMRGLAVHLELEIFARTGTLVGKETSPALKTSPVIEASAGMVDLLHSVRLPFVSIRMY